MKPHLVQRKIHPPQAGLHRRIRASRRLRHDREHLPRAEFPPRAQKLEQRETIRPLHRQITRAFDRFEVIDAQEIRVLERSDARDLALDLRSGGRPLQELRLEPQQPHIPLQAGVAGAEKFPRIRLPARLGDAVARGDRRTGLPSRLRGPPRNVLEQRGKILLVPHRLSDRARGVGKLAGAGLDFLPQLRRRLRPARRIFLQHAPQQHGKRRWKIAELLEGRGLRKMLAHHLGHRPREGRLPGEHVPERDAEAVDVAPHIDVFFLELLGTRKVRRADEAAHRHRRRILGPTTRAAFSQAKVDHLHHQLVVLAHEHEVRRLDVAMHEFVPLRCI